ncbi:DNA replication complex GINS protein PSF1 isoform X2 [Diachasma alloeum]|uniref:DNA replication complex GINS protein PSF1 isoform X2 n=1 Tax=Diachasma alloeum TaxID=454923 RepID=UPI0007381C2D|nr:DNA replication complex GINS protein PSF1 isoform X2 [Diachasma alloeum]
MKCKLYTKLIGKMFCINFLLLHERNATLADSTATSRYTSVQLRHAALNRNKRCLLTYVYNRMQRIRKMRWEFGSVLPPEINSNLMPLENQWFQAYSKSLATYMKSIGDNYGLNLTMDMIPPKSLYIEVRCLVDYGKLELEDGQIISLTKNTHHLLPRAQCEALVRQGILEHIST